MAEEEAMSLFMKIDRNKQAIRHGAEIAATSTTKKRDMQELKGLVFSIKFKSNGLRNSGK